MKLDIERASHLDLPAIAAVTVESWQTTFQQILPDAFLTELTVESQLRRHEKLFASSGVFYYVARQGDQVVGFSSGGPNRDPSPDVPNELYGLYLLKEWHGQGTGRSLLTTLAMQLQTPDQPGLIALVLANNPHRDFYQRLGGLRQLGQPLELGGRSWPVDRYTWRQALTQ